MRSLTMMKKREGDKGDDNEKKNVSEVALGAVEAAAVGVMEAVERWTRESPRRQKEKAKRCLEWLQRS